MFQFQTIRRLLDAADVNQAPYAVADAATTLLAASPQDAPALGHYARALCTLGLVPAARRILQSIIANHLPLAPTAQAILEQIPAPPSTPSTVGSGAIPWTSRQRRFQANLRALATRHPQFADLADQFNQVSTQYELYQAQDGNYQILNVAAPSPWQGWLGTLQDHKALSTAWTPQRAPDSITLPVAFHGLGFGWLFLHVAKLTERAYLNYSCALYVLEPQPAALAMVMHLHDLREIFSHPRLRLYLGTDCLTALESDLQQRETWTPPSNYIVNPILPTTLPMQERCEALLLERQQAQDEATARCHQMYADRDHLYWRERYAAAATGSGPPLRVLGITTRYSTVLKNSMAELADAIRASGCQMEVLSEEDDQSLEFRLPWRIMDFQPDLIVQISRMRHECPDLPKNVPALCWDQDSLPYMRTPQATASLDRLTYVAGHGAVHGYTYLDWPRANCIMAAPAAATHHYQPGPLTPTEHARYDCAISYVSNASTIPETRRETLRTVFLNHPSLLVVFDHASSHLLADHQSGTATHWNHVNLQALLEASLTATGQELSATPRHEIEVQLILLADRCFRHTALGWAHQFCQATNRKLRIYGAGWEKHPLLAPCAAGPAAFGREMNCIYQASRINLQLIETGFLHSRALDGLAAGGFFLARFTIFDGRSTREVQVRRAIAVFLRQHPVRTYTELESALPPPLRTDWDYLQTLQYQPDGGRVISERSMLRLLELYSDLPGALDALPGFSEILFHDAASFARQAEHFLTSEPDRLRLRDQLRQAVLARFSYDARWQQFRAGITAGLRSG